MENDKVPKSEIPVKLFFAILSKLFAHIFIWFFEKQIFRISLHVEIFESVKSVETAKSVENRRRLKLGWYKNVSKFAINSPEVHNSTLVTHELKYWASKSLVAVLTSQNFTGKPYVARNWVNNWNSFSKIFVTILF